MSSKNTSLPIDSLDFDDIKTNLKSYLESQDTFSEYNFEGSGLNILLDVLSYNTHYQAFYNNMVISESFIDSAVKEDSIYSILKLLNYIPETRISSEAVVDLFYRDTGGSLPDSNGILSEQRSFSATVDGTTYVFFNKDAIEFEPCKYNDSGLVTEWKASDISIFEGEYNDIDFVFDGLDTTRFRIPEDNIDIRFLRVYVKDSETQSNTISNEWKRSDSILNIDGDSKVFFVQRGIGGRFEVEFGDDVIGKKPTVGDVITIEYVKSSGNSSNNIGVSDTAGNRSFSISGPTNTEKYEVVVKTKSFGGAEKENVTFSKKHGPRNFQSQNRLVTAEDYKTEILKRFPLLKSVLVYGGEDADPPQYGKVFIVANTKNSIPLSNSSKNSIIKDIIKKKNVVSIIPEFVDVDYTYLNLVLDVLHNQSFTTRSTADVQQVVKSKIQEYTDIQLEEFGANFRGSTVIRDVVESEGSVVSAFLSLLMEKRIDVKNSVGVPTDYTTLFADPILKKSEGSVYSNKFVYDTRDSYVEDDGNGVLRIYHIDKAGNKVTSKSNIGTVNYDTGLVTIRQLNITSIVNDVQFKLYACPRTNDVEVERNQILVIDETTADSVKVNMSLSSDDPITQ
ncbi:MAG TPA: hypothetical protein DF712_15540 [Balneola sp.]|nr:hypothetical protein [Balneola sp.]|tara:strand:+ start:5161 stop:7020 length:1860 start_codon:yes stop_codon:yes gene_type:complete